MAASPVVLDTSAVLTLLEDEPGADRVEALLRSGREILLPFVVLLETHYVTLQRRGEAEADRRFALLRQLPVSVLTTLDDGWILAAARLKARHRISLADALVAGLARRRQATLVHCDPEFRVLEGEISLEDLSQASSAPG